MWKTAPEYSWCTHAPVCTQVHTGAWQCSSVQGAAVCAGQRSMCARQCTVCVQGKATTRDKTCNAGSSMHRVTLPSMLSRHQLVPANSPASVHVDADATVAAQTHAAGIESPFLREQHAEPHSGTPIAIPSSGRLFPDTAKGHMAMVCCFAVAV